MKIIKTLSLTLLLTVSSFAQTTPPTTQQDIKDSLTKVIAAVADLTSKLDAFSQQQIQIVNDNFAATNKRVSDLEARATRDETTYQSRADSADAALDQIRGTLPTLQAAVNDLTSKLDDALSIAAKAVAISTTLKNATPCAILNLAVAKNELGQTVITFSTPTALCTGWGGYSGQIDMQRTRAAFAPVGQVSNAYDFAQKSDFVFALPSNAPTSGTIQVFTIDPGGIKTYAQIQYP